MKTNLNIVCFGEVLYDVFPTHKKIGGAPLNVGLRLSSLGVNAHILSRIGNDQIGKEILSFVKEKGANVSSIQIDDIYHTGEVIVQLDHNGSASYTINYPVAWDKIICIPEDEIIIKKADAFVFGSLSCRDAVSRNSLLELLTYAKYKVFDVNLRAPYYSATVLNNLMMQSDFIKFNQEELDEISESLNSPSYSLEHNMIYIAEKTNTPHLCVTRGSQGAVLYYNKQFYYNEGYIVKVADTVGSGDSFLAGLLSQLLTDKNPQEALDFACALGALVAKKEGANPKISNKKIYNLMFS